MPSTFIRNVSKWDTWAYSGKTMSYLRNPNSLISIHMRSSPDRTGSFRSNWSLPSYTWLERSTRGPWCTLTNITRSRFGASPVVVHALFGGVSKKTRKKPEMWSKWRVSSICWKEIYYPTLRWRKVVEIQVWMKIANLSIYQKFECLD